MLAATIMAKIKACHLQGKDEEELLMQLDDQKPEQARHHMVRVLGETDFKLFKIDVVSESIARAVAVISQHPKEDLRTFYKGRKNKPLEQWPKMTHGWQHMQSEHKDSLRPKAINKRNKPRVSLLGYKTAVY
ncbi:60S ribosomal protein L35-like [Egretta garzetta]|uniref:60S ribosomal protein L35-like n=1 Tax=Egretta garzetta TaxID=188379 RepID=UPI00051EF300|nr:60S ribosomal protein L35-like [Egretta garzetta]